MGKDGCLKMPENEIDSIIEDEQNKSLPHGLDPSLSFEDFIRSKDIIQKTIGILASKSTFLVEFARQELSELNNSLTKKPNRYEFEIKYVIFNLMIEMKEVIEIFCSKNLLNNSLKDQQLDQD